MVFAIIKCHRLKPCDRHSTYNITYFDIFILTRTVFVVVVLFHILHRCYIFFVTMKLLLHLFNPGSVLELIQIRFEFTQLANPVFGSIDHPNNFSVVLVPLNKFLEILEPGRYLDHNLISWELFVFELIPLRLIIRVNPLQVFF